MSRLPDLRTGCGLVSSADSLKSTHIQGVTSDLSADLADSCVALTSEAQGEASSRDVQVRAHCAQSTTLAGAGQEVLSLSKYSPASVVVSALQQAKASVKCPPSFVMSGCSCVSETSSCRGSEILQDGDGRATCHAYASAQPPPSGIQLATWRPAVAWAVAQCLWVGSSNSVLDGDQPLGECPLPSSDVSLIEDEVVTWWESEGQDRVEDAVNNGLGEVMEAGATDGPEGIRQWFSDNLGIGSGRGEERGADDGQDPKPKDPPPSSSSPVVIEDADGKPAAQQVGAQGGSGGLIGAILAGFGALACCGAAAVYLNFRNRTKHQERQRLEDSMSTQVAEAQAVQAVVLENGLTAIPVSNNQPITATTTEVTPGL